MDSDFQLILKICFHKSNFLLDTSTRIYSWNLKFNMYTIKTPLPGVSISVNGVFLPVLCVYNLQMISGSFLSLDSYIWVIRIFYRYDLYKISQSFPSFPSPPPAPSSWLSWAFTWTIAVALKLVSSYWSDNSYDGLD